MKNILIKLIRWYRKISPGLFIIGSLGLIHPQCKFQPTCSQYAEMAIEKHGALKGIPLIIKRIFKCHPLSKGGVDIP